jgi:hypothetical protein
MRRLAVFALLCACAVAAGFPAAAQKNNPDEKAWIQLFNGRDLKDWTPKFAHHDLGVNHNDTFRVEDGLLKVRYDKWTGFNGEFGHLFYKEPFSYYLLAAEYRFVGEQVTGAGPKLSWALRNNGLMLHSPDPKTMLKDQDFPISIEVQLLGGLTNGKPRSTLNLCTPGTNVVMEGELVTRHCTSSRSKTYHGDQWVTVEVEVEGGKVIRHLIDGQPVLSYSAPQLDDRDPHARELIQQQGGKLLESGSISLQSESHPIEFRKVDLQVLEK